MEAEAQGNGDGASAGAGAGPGQEEEDKRLLEEDKKLLEDDDDLVPQLKGQTREPNKDAEAVAGAAPQNGTASGVPEGTPGVASTETQLQGGTPTIERTPVLEVTKESVTVPGEAGPVTLTEAGPLPAPVNGDGPPLGPAFNLDKPLSRGPPQSLSDYSFLWNEALLDKEAAKSGLYQALRPKVRLVDPSFLPHD